MVALTMDDGYRDNLIRLVPLLEEVGGRATVFLEAGAVVERRLPWLHALGWLDAELGTAAAARALAERVPSAAAALSEVSDSNRLKRVLKYDADRAERSAALEALVLAHGGQPRAIVDSLYLSTPRPESSRELIASKWGGTPSITRSCPGWPRRSRVNRSPGAARSSRSCSRAEGAARPWGAAGGPSPIPTAGTGIATRTRRQPRATPATTSR